MAPKKQLTPQEQEKRHRARLARAYGMMHGPGTTTVTVATRSSYERLRAVVHALIPGEQTSKHVMDGMEKAVTAYCKRIRIEARRAR